MTTEPPQDTRLERLRTRLEQPQPVTPTESTAESTQAAVALVLREGSELDLLLIKRAVSEIDPWSGHIALPGGKWDATDQDMLHTAVRETAEETGMQLDQERRHLGSLALAGPFTERIPKLTVHPFVFTVPAETEAWVNSAEVESVLWVPLTLLRAPESRGTTRVMLPGGPREFPCFKVHGEVVWGLTFRMLSDFLVRAP